MQNSGIERFLLAQKNYYPIAKRELEKGQKRLHWMWFIFPQLKGLGQSETSLYYGLKNKKEVEDYYKNFTLRRRMKNLLRILLKYEDGTKIEDVFGELDAIKLKSCLTLFYTVTWEEIFKKVLDKYYNGCLDMKTVILLNKIEGVL